MQPESICKIARGGNASALEEDWMRLLESEQATPRRLAQYDVVLQTLCENGRQELAETIAWTAIEGLRSQHDDGEVVALAGRFLTVIGKSAVLENDHLVPSTANTNANHGFQIRNNTPAKPTGCAPWDRS